MKIMEMSKADFATVPYLDLWTDWKKLAPTGKLMFHSFVIIPIERDGKIDLHDSGWGCMEIVLINDNMEPIGKVGGGCDVINIDGIGGLGYKWYERPNHMQQLVPAHGWSVDCLPCGYLHMWTKRDLFLPNSFVGSNFEPYSEDHLRQRKE